jgi:hypothetical protein
MRESRIDSFTDAPDMYAVEVNRLAIWTIRKQEELEGGQDNEELSRVRAQAGRALGFFPGLASRD